MKPAVIAAYVRSPFTPAHKGELARVRPDDIATQVVQGLLHRSGINGADIEDLIMGCAFPEGEQGFNMARMVALMAGLPQSVAGATINRFCGSSMQAIHMAAGAIAMGSGEAFICAGVESLSRMPMTGFNPMPNPVLFKTHPEAYMGMGETAENVAKKCQVTREQQDEFAVLSQQKAIAAAKAGHFEEELVPINAGEVSIDHDSCLKPDSTLEALAVLKPAFMDGGSVTAATSSPLTDGAAATLVCCEAYAERHYLTPMARILSTAVAGCAPETMGLGPIAASRKALQRVGLTIDDIDLFEINEAFASQAIACIRELNIPMDKVNLDGGAIALGHPLGATGARITGKAAALLKREHKRYALATQCIGGGQGIATVLEIVE